MDLRSRENSSTACSGDCAIQCAEDCSTCTAGSADGATPTTPIFSTSTCHATTSHSDGHGRQRGFSGGGTSSERDMHLESRLGRFADAFVLAIHVANDGLIAKRAHLGEFRHVSRRLETNDIAFGDVRGALRRRAQQENVHACARKLASGHLQLFAGIAWYVGESGSEVGPTVTVCSIREPADLSGYASATTVIWLVVRVPCDDGGKHRQA